MSSTAQSSTAQSSTAQSSTARPSVPVPPAAPGPLPRDSRVFVAGHHGLVGSAVWRHLTAQGFSRLFGMRSRDVDLRDRDAVRRLFDTARPQVLILAAARVGGILANATYPADFLSDNLRIQTNVLDAAHEYDVQRLLFLGSSCIYPRLAPQPIPESALLTGPLEPTNDAYAIAKIAGVLHVQAMRRQHGHRWISAMPTNLYGPGDNFDSAGSHVLPAMIRRFHEARTTSARVVTIWGTGTPRREFLHVDDLASACLFLLENYDEDVAVNVGVGSDVSIRELAELTAEIVGWQGRLEFDPSKPDGTPRKVLDVSRLDHLGWRPTIALADGLASTYEWYRENLQAGDRTLTR